MNFQKISIQNKTDQQLGARLDLPLDGEPLAYALFAHCFTCTKNLKAVGNISRALTRERIAVLRFDFTGLGESEGDFADTNFSSNVDDLICAARFLEKTYQAPSILIGHSLGGAAVILAAGALESVKAVATIGAPASPAHVKHLFKEKIDAITEKGEATVTLGGRDFTIKKQFVEDLEAKNMEQRLKALRRALLVMHSPQDKTVGIDNAAAIYTAAHHSKSFVSLDGADHLLTDQSDSRYAGAMIGCWVKRYLHLPEAPKLKTDQQVLARIGAEKYVTDIKARQHHLTADEPEEVGGQDLGPSPYDLVTAGLGACTAMTLRMYADRKKWNLKEVRVHLSHGKIHAEDCEDCETQKGKIDRFERILEVEGELDEQQKNRLVEIANKCPVHRTLHSEVVVKTWLKTE